MSPEIWRGCIYLIPGWETPPGSGTFIARRRVAGSQSPWGQREERVARHRPAPDTVPGSLIAAPRESRPAERNDARKAPAQGRAAAPGSRCRARIYNPMCFATEKNRRNSEFAAEDSECDYKTVLPRNVNTLWRWQTEKKGRKQWLWKIRSLQACEKRFEWNEKIEWTLLTLTVPTEGKLSK